MSSEYVIEASTGSRRLGLGDVWASRELLYFLVWRDLKLRFKQTALGVVWIVLRPVLSMLIFTAVFGRLARLPSDGVPYPVFVLAGLLSWNYFSTALIAATNSVVSNAHLVTKVYFPRLVIPLSALVSAAVDAAISFVVLLVLMAFYKTPLTATALLVAPLFLVLAALSLGAGLWLGALNVRYRDVGNLIPFALQIAMYATPVVYPLSLIPQRWRGLVALNPMTGVVDALRAALLGRPIAAVPLAMSVAAAAALLASGIVFFRSSERSFADVV